MSNILVSVVMITYCHEKYIREAINSVLIQNCKFDIELIIANDCSPDLTHDIVVDIMRYHSRSKLIKYTRHLANKGSAANMIWALKQAKGKYIALCEGDDYWINENKLQTQFDFLEQNPDFNLCFHNVKILKNDNLFSDDFLIKTNKHVTNIYDLSVWGNYIHTCSVLFRNINIPFDNFPLDYICDFYLYILVVNTGKVKKFSTVMAVYRYGNGIWASSSEKDKYKFLVNNIYNLLNSTDDDTIKEILINRLNSIAIFSLPKYITKIEIAEDRSFHFVLNEKIPFSILFNIFFKKIYNFLKNNFKLLDLSKKTSF